MSVSENKAIAQRVIDEGFNGRRLAVFDELLAPTFANHDPNNPQVADLNTFKELVKAFWAAFPDLHVQLIDAIGEDDRVVHVWVERGTQTGAFSGIPATGRQIELVGMALNHLAYGKITSTLWSYDMLGMLQQLGVVPAPGQAPA